MEHPEKHVVAVGDLSDTDGITPWVRQQVERAGMLLDGIVHSAGVSNIVPLRVVSRANMDQVTVPNVYASIALLRAMSRKDIVSAEGGSETACGSAGAEVASPEGESGVACVCGTDDC